MALGYCPECDKLVSIEAGPHYPGSRQQQWRAVPHDRPGGGACDGAGQDVDPRPPAPKAPQR